MESPSQPDQPKQKSDTDLCAAIAMLVNEVVANNYKAYYWAGYRTAMTHVVFAVTGYFAVDLLVRGVVYIAVEYFSL